MNDATAGVGNWHLLGIEITIIGRTDSFGKKNSSMYVSGVYEDHTAIFIWFYRVVFFLEGGGMLSGQT